MLRPAGEHALAAPGERWPVVDGIAFLRVGREALVARCLAALDAGDLAEATALLLQDRDDWAPGEPPALDACRDLVRRRDALGFREAMQRLSFGPVGDYLAYRWSDPTFLSGLALAEAYWTERPRVLEVACGTGAFLRSFIPHAAAVTGADVVFSKLWLARHYVAPAARLLCFDVGAPWPLPPGAADIAFCHDAFYFLPDKSRVATALFASVGRQGRVLVGHVHNRAAANHSAGDPVTVADLAALFPGAALFDDAELTRALVERRAPAPAGQDALATVPALSAACAPVPPGALRGLLDLPPPGAELRRNPLYVGGARATLRFPSARYAAEYAASITCPAEVEAPLAAVATGADDELVRTRVLVDLPVRW